MSESENATNNTGNALILAQIHQSILIIRTPNEVEEALALVSVAPDYLRPRYCQVDIGLDEGAPTSAAQICRLLQLLPEVEDLCITLPLAIAQGAFNRVFLRSLTKFSTNLQFSTISKFLSLHPRIDTIALMCQPTIPYEPYAVSPILNQLRVPFLGLHTLSVDVNHVGDCMSDSLEQILKNTVIRQTLFPHLRRLIVQTTPGDVPLMRAISRVFPNVSDLTITETTGIPGRTLRDRVMVRRPWSDVADWRQLLRSLQCLEHLSLYVTCPLFSGDLGDIDGEWGTIDGWITLNPPGLPHPTLRRIQLAYSAQSGFPPGVLSTWQRICVESIEDSGHQQSQVLEGGLEGSQITHICVTPLQRREFRGEPLAREVGFRRSDQGFRKGLVAVMKGNQVLSKSVQLPGDIVACSAQPFELRRDLNELTSISCTLRLQSRHVQLDARLAIPQRCYVFDLRSCCGIPVRVVHGICDAVGINLSAAAL
ncbi:uncharacterized protein BXZ73DRAFT_84123 [Epithele typhae]|uniref:uncharacterized protein n=1 Tax=Epithele typhae TaxID=378194 RepID=UPI002007A021|nr:uncharacterized protein BXZ73DRAFT_84123 [Epithele typhae]KAH9909425.1 hypothetical protein BXZ73DRAFT_84123 [Epithele typhae]